MRFFVPLLLLTGALCVLPNPASAQQTPPLFQTVRGVVLDRDSRAPLPGANILIVGIEPVMGTTTDSEGRFVVPHVPVGRRQIRASFLGFEPALLPEVLVTAGKEVFLSITLQEQVLQGQEVVVEAGAEKDRPHHEMAFVSARSFSVEETRRYAGGLDDPARMASAFAGIASAGGVQDNALSIRGHSPKGVQWRLQGVEIPNPNHFAGLSVAGGGGLTLFSSQLLASSDVMTGAFPAAFGNALAGVFDMQFRPGNASRREHTLQLGLIGVEAASEGPFHAGGDASYLINYRYSTLGLLLPLLPTESATTFQDLAFHVNIPTRRAGRFSLWGMGGSDRQSQRATMDSTAWEYDFWDRVDSDLKLDIGVAGVTHHALLGARTYLQSRLAASINRTLWDWVRLDDSLQRQPDLLIDSRDTRATASVQLNHKFSARHTHEVSLSVHRLGYDLTLRDAPDQQPPAVTLAAGDGQAYLLEAGAQSRFRPTDRLTLALGVHATRFGLTGSGAIEPRFALQWQASRRQTLSLGIGRHSQTEELRIYFADPNGDGRPDNGALGLARAHHFVLGYDLALSDVRRIKIETYYQHLFNIPVTPDSSYSMLNFEQDWGFNAALTNAGAGANAGIEFTLERFLRDGYYYLLTASLFDARYRGGDGVWRGSRFDRGYAINALAGKEIALRGGRRTLGVNGRLIGLGGKRYSPIDHAASIQEEQVVLDENSPFDARWPATFLVDFTVTYRIDRPEKSHVWALQVKNALGAKDRYFDFNYLRSAVETLREGFPLPVLSYKIEF
ncbi:MAG: TonB-dependent receptor [Rhodothermales bacterium]|nr:TonB-dependent receptor [Rhodothermales bacterium]